MTIDFEFFKDSMNYFRELRNQQVALETALDCDIYGGPMKCWDRELDIWRKILNDNVRSFAILTVFAAYYAGDKMRKEITFDWNNNNCEYITEILKLEGSITDDNWLKFVWETLLHIEGEENESR